MIIAIHQEGQSFGVVRKCAESVVAHGASPRQKLWDEDLSIASMAEYINYTCRGVDISPHRVDFQVRWSIFFPHWQWVEEMLVAFKHILLFKSNSEVSAAYWHTHQETSTTNCWFQIHNYVLCNYRMQGGGPGPEKQRGTVSSNSRFRIWPRASREFVICIYIYIYIYIRETQKGMVSSNWGFERYDFNSAPPTSQKSARSRSPSILIQYSTVQYSMV